LDKNYFLWLVHTANADETNCLVLSVVVFTPPTRQDKTVLSRLQSKLGRDDTKPSWWRYEQAII